MYIAIDGTDITSYIGSQGIAWSRSDVANSVETMDGTVHRGRKAIKMSLDITCREVNTTELRMIQNLISPQSVSVVYDDPIYGQRTATMYSESGTSKLLVHHRDGTDWWSGVSFTLKEM